MITGVIDQNGNPLSNSAGIQDLEGVLIKDDSTGEFTNEISWAAPLVGGSPNEQFRYVVELQVRQTDRSLYNTAAPIVRIPLTGTMPDTQAAIEDFPMNPSYVKLIKSYIGGSPTSITIIEDMIIINQLPGPRFGRFVSDLMRTLGFKKSEPKGKKETLTDFKSRKLPK